MYGLVYKKEKLFSFRKIISFFSWSYELVLIFLGCFLWHYIQLSFFIKLIILDYMILQFMSRLSYFSLLMNLTVVISSGSAPLHDLHIFQCRILKYIIPNSFISTVVKAIKISKMATKLSSSCFFFFIFPS